MIKYFYQFIQIILLGIAFFSLIYYFENRINNLQKNILQKEEEYNCQIEELKKEYEMRAAILQSEIDFMELSLEAAKEGLLIYNEEIEIPENDWDLLYRVVAAEAGYTSEQGIKNVCYVIFNRVKSERFPNTIREVLTQPSQFTTPPANKMITEELINYVHLAYDDYLHSAIVADDALFFCKGNFIGREFLFEDELGHRFFR